MMERKNDKVYKVVLTALMAALCYVAFTFLKIPIPTFGGDYVALHIGNVFWQPCCWVVHTEGWPDLWA